jgi:hypothetical protein
MPRPIRSHPHAWTTTFGVRARNGLAAGDEKRAAYENRPAAPIRDEAADGRGGEPGNGGDGAGQNGRKIVGGAPGEDLRHAEGGDDRAPAPRRAGRVYHQAAVRQPQPVRPSSLATASATQQASTLSGSGPPQRPLATVPACGGRALQTPVSGSTRRTNSS